MAENADDEATRQMRRELIAWWLSAFDVQGSATAAEFRQFAVELAGISFYTTTEIIGTVGAEKVKQLWTKHLQLLMKHGGF